jgi:TRAP-type C4-dicarboxylate transport system substrate-binding protein
VEKAGVKVTHPDKAPFRQASQTVWKEFEGTEIGELARRITEVQ